MPIIKASQSAAMLKSAIVLDLGDLSRQAEAMRQAAQEKAATILAEAGAEAQRLVAQARGQGFEAGRVEGHQQGLELGRKQGHAEALMQSSERLAVLAQAWEKALTEWESRRGSLEHAARQQVLELALKLAQKIVRRQAQVDPTVIAAQLQHALGQVLKPTDVTVRICPDDRALAQEALPGILAKFPQFKHVALVDDPMVAAGGCVLHYGQGRIDASIDTQLQRLVELLLPTAAPGSAPAADGNA